MTRYFFILIFAVYGCQGINHSESIIEIKTEIAEFKNRASKTDTIFILKSTEKFDDKEQLISKIEFYDNGNPEHEYYYEYNNNGLLSKTSMIDHYGTGSTNSEEYKYNSSDSLIYKNTTENTFFLIDSFIRDSNNRTLIHKTYLKADTLVRFREFKYNSNDRIKVIKTFNRGAFLIDSIGYYYNNSGLISEEYIYRRNQIEIVDYSSEHTYDSFGNMTKSKIYFDSDSSYTIVDREFYTNGELKTLKTSGVGYTRFNSTKQEFDSLGNMTSHRIIDDGGNADKNSSTRFDYNSKGNWISKKSYYQNKLMSITRRILKYE